MSTIISQIKTNDCVEVVKRIAYGKSVQNKGFSLGKSDESEFFVKKGLEKSFLLRYL